jgi:hypothetical protein
MKNIQLKSTLIALTVCCAMSAQALDFGLPSVPGVGGGGGAAKSTETAAQVVVKARLALVAFTSAQLQLLDAINGTNSFEAQKKTLDALSKGDASASQDDLKTVVSISKDASDMLSQKLTENAKLDAKNKSAAGKAMVNYVIALVSTKSLIGSVQNLASNPMSAGTELGTLTFLVSQLPGIVTNGVSSTTSLFKYLTANGVDMRDAQKAADGLGK